MADETSSHPRRSGILIGFTMALTIFGAFFGLANNILGIFGYALVRQETKEQMALSLEQNEAARVSLDKLHAELNALKERSQVLEKENESLKTAGANSGGKPITNSSASAAAVNSATPQETPNPKYSEFVNELHSILIDEPEMGHRYNKLTDNMNNLGPELEFADMLRFLRLMNETYRYNTLQVLNRKLKSKLTREQLAELEKLDWGRDESQFKQDALQLKLKMD
jgi:hypothetical protein